MRHEFKNSRIQVVKEKEKMDPPVKPENDENQEFKGSSIQE